MAIVGEQGPEIHTPAPPVEMYLNGKRYAPFESDPEVISPIRVRVESVIYDTTSVYSARYIHYRTAYMHSVGKCEWMPEWGYVAFGSIVDLVVDADGNILLARVIA